MRTKVGIIGAGPAGLLLSQLLHSQGIDTVVLEARDRDYIEARQRAGMLEQGTADLLRSCGAGERLDREGLVHHGIHLRFNGENHHLDFPDLTGGSSVVVYAQTEIVKDLVRLHVDRGAALHFGAKVTGVEDVETAPKIRYVQDGVEHVLDCDFVAACDGFHGVGRQSIPADVLRTFERNYPFAWLGILADVAPSTDDLIYAYSERGFALHSMRSPEVSRLYVQVEPDADINDWSDERIWAELHARLELQGWSLKEGPITEKSITPMRSFVTEPMRYGKLFLAGDAAHIVPPTGAKGLNLAAGDVAVLAEALTGHYSAADDSLLDTYSETCLRRVWRAEHFSYFMTTLLHKDPSQTPFEQRLQLSNLAYVASSRAAATSLAENYVGYRK